jgi:hypothetical protein
MFENRISELFQFASGMNIENDNIRNGERSVSPRLPAPVTVRQLLPMVTTQDIYQMAAAQARNDYELDRLFNPDYYRDGSGI